MRDGVTENDDHTRVGRRREDVVKVRQSEDEREGVGVGNATKHVEMEKKVARGRMFRANVHRERKVVRFGVLAKRLLRRSREVWAPDLFRQRDEYALKRILSEFEDVDTFLRTQIQTMEWQQEFVFKPASERVGYPITQVINIWNLRGLTLKLFTSDIKAVTKKAMQLTQDNYPESLYQSYIINAPTIFTIIWSVIKIFLDAKTRNKVHIMGHGKHVFEHLAKKLGPNCLVTAEMVQSKFRDIGIAERKLGFESAHKICQDYVREQLRTKTNLSIRLNRFSKGKKKSWNSATTNSSTPATNIGG